MEFEPRIVAFLCSWCSYSAADAAGAAHRDYPWNVRVVRVMCSGRVDPTFVLKALSKGADGVLVCGCHPGDCHYVNGNCRAAGRIALLGRTLRDLGIEEDRLRLEWISASEAERFVQVTIEMTDRLRALGPLDWPSLDRAPAIGSTNPRRASNGAPTGEGATNLEAGNVEADTDASGTAGRAAAPGGARA